MTCRTHHDHAMLLAERGAYALAADSEAMAAELAGDAEPSRGILYRSAATLALLAGRTERAADLARIGLAGRPHPEIADELREVLGRADPWYALLARADLRRLAHVPAAPVRDDEEG